jgi:signal transduction histidine kinase
VVLFSGFSQAGVNSVPYEALDQRDLLLATLPPTQRQVWAAFGVVMVLIALSVVTLPFHETPLPHVEALVPILATTIVINDFLTSVLLFSQFSIARRRALLVLASGYLFSSLIVIPWALTFPGVFAPTGLLGAGLQTTAWLYAFWHAGAPLILIVATLLRDLDNNPSESRLSPAAAIALSVVVVSATVCTLTWTAIAAESFLPQLFLDRTHVNRSVNLTIGSLIAILIVIALALLWVRRRSVLELWLMVVCCAWLFEFMISAVLINARFSLGFYVGRVFGIFSTFIVLLVLLSQTLALYASLARSIIRRRTDRNARLMIMDAMAASIAHEIGQPLTAIGMNASAGLRLLTMTTPDVNEARASFEDIVNDCNRANGIIGGIRSMFKKGAHGRLLLDVNDVMREVIKIVDLDLRTHSVSVFTDLRNDLPQLVADRGQLHQVFLNLITNAIDAMDSVTDRARQLRVSSNVIEGSSNIVVRIEDSGTGIDGSDNVSVFEPFYTTKSTGTGIGLSICKSIIEAHHGNVRASANKPFGAIFEVTLPTGDL